MPKPTVSIASILVPSNVHHARRFCTGDDKEVTTSPIVLCRDNLRDETVRKFDSAPDIVPVDVANDHTLTNEAQPQRRRKSAGEWNRLAVRLDSEDTPVTRGRFVARGRDGHYPTDISDEETPPV